MQAILNLTRHSIGNQCNCSSRKSEFVDRHLEPQTTTWAAAFCARWKTAFPRNFEASNSDPPHNRRTSKKRPVLPPGEHNRVLVYAVSQWWRSVDDSESTKESPPKSDHFLLGDVQLLPPQTSSESIQSFCELSWIQKRMDPKSNILGSGEYVYSSHTASQLDNNEGETDNIHYMN